MPQAIVLINVEIGSEADVLKALKKIEGVEQAFAVYGIYDVVANVKADALDKLNDIVTKQIRKIENIKSTTTMIVIDESRLGLEWIRT
ncbi:MAG: Lrp/AsnC ligand binding domain-containing protein [Nitrososphaeria archaeon]